MWFSFQICFLSGSLNNCPSGEERPHVTRRLVELSVCLTMVWWEESNCRCWNPPSGKPPPGPGVWLVHKDVTSPWNSDHVPPGVFIWTDQKPGSSPCSWRNLVWGWSSRASHQVHLRVPGGTRCEAGAAEPHTRFLSVFLEEPGVRLEQPSLTPGSSPCSWRNQVWGWSSRASHQAHLRVPGGTWCEAGAAEPHTRFLSVFLEEPGVRLEQPSLTPGSSPCSWRNLVWGWSSRASHQVPLRVPGGTSCEAGAAEPREPPDPSTLPRKQHRTTGLTRWRSENQSVSHVLMCKMRSFSLRAALIDFTFRFLKAFTQTLRSRSDVLLLRQFSWAPAVNSCVVCSLYFCWWLLSPGSSPTQLYTGFLSKNNRLKTLISPVCVRMCSACARSVRLHSDLTSSAPLLVFKLLLWASSIFVYSLSSGRLLLCGGI